MVSFLVFCFFVDCWFCLFFRLFWLQFFIFNFSVGLFFFIFSLFFFLVLFFFFFFFVFSRFSFSNLFLLNNFWYLVFVTFKSLIYSYIVLSLLSVVSRKFEKSFSGSRSSFSICSSLVFTIFAFLFMLRIQSKNSLLDISFHRRQTQ